MFVLIMGDAQFTLTSEDVARLYRASTGKTWIVRTGIADRVQIDTPEFTLTAPTNWREMIGAQR
jgi:hypothetical protein